MQIQDAAGLVSGLNYNSIGWPQTLVTPYGPTSFEYGDGMGGDAGFRWVRVTEPNGGAQIYLFNIECSTLWNGNPWLPESFAASLVPSNLPAGTQLDNHASQLNSFYWDQKQSVGISTNLSLMTTNQMNRARMRHWLFNNIGGLESPDLAISFEVLPSQSTDGSGGLGGITWYDYPGKPAAGQSGTNMQPCLIARVLPDGSTWYRSIQRNSWSLPTSVTETYDTGNPAPTRTYSYVYDPTGLDLMEVRRPGNELVSSYTYNGRHQKLTETRYADGSTSYTDTWTYNDPQGRLTSFTSAAGQTTTYNYAPSGSFAGYLSGTTESPVSRSEVFTWLNGYVRTQQDYRGLTRTFTRDGLNRLTQVDYPAHDGLVASSVQYSYTLVTGHGFNTSGPNTNILHLTAVKDRRDKWTYYDRDRLGRLSRVTDPLNHSTSYTYCGCGSPDSITDARNKPTTFTYNNSGWKTAVLYADNTSESFGFDAFGRMTSRTDSLGTRNYSYNNQGLLTLVTTTYGTERSVGYNIHDQPTTEVDANGVSVTKTFDRQGRALTRAVPGQGTEVFVYSARGLTDYTGPDSKVTHYGYDQLSRKTSETTPKTENIGYSYSAGGDLLTLTDGRNKVTRWWYDVEGLLRSKQYAGQSFTNLTYTYRATGQVATRKYWTSGSGGAQTSYSYDDAGNLLTIDYPTSPDVTFTYNEVNKMSTMTTVGLGTNTFTYTDAENPATEGGLWASDTVSWGYHASAPRLRTSLTVAQPSGTWSQSYGYDAADRMQSITSPAGTFTYSYKGPGTAWTNLALPNTAAITNDFDSGGRMTITALKNNNGTLLNKHGYLYNGGGQRQRNTLLDGSYTTYGYDDDSQLSSSLGYTSGGVPVTSEQLTFLYDPGWNLTNRAVNGAGSTYTVDDRNQLLTEPGLTDVYDANGNLYQRLSGGYVAYTYTYDNEQRLTSVVYALSTVATSTWWRTDYTYDGLSRVRVRQDYVWMGSGWYPDTNARYLYDGMRVVQERSTGNAPAVAYTRGKDLSGTLEGAGGIGGLLARSHGYSGGSWSTHNFYHADALGNVTYMVSSAQAMVASYKYDPYGRTITSSGTLASANLYRFSSKEVHPKSGMYYYGYRFYHPTLQRWLNRDPIEEWGGINLYGMCFNMGLNAIDPEGLGTPGPGWSFPKTIINPTGGPPIVFVPPPSSGGGGSEGNAVPSEPKVPRGFSCTTPVGGWVTITGPPPVPPMRFPPAPLPPPPCSVCGVNRPPPVIIL